MNINNILDILTETDADTLLVSILKLFLILGGLLYVVFTFVVVRQIDIMKKTLITQISPLITTLGIVHLTAAVVILIYFILM